MEGYQAECQKITDDVSKITIKGFLDAHTASQFEELLKSLIEEGQVRLIVDMDKLNYISSTGLGVFMGYIEDIREKGGDIKFVRVPDKIYKIFAILGFTAIYEIFNEEGEAIEKF
jgi:anti-sigma B factor antagonist